MRILYYAITGKTVKPSIFSRYCNCSVRNVITLLFYNSIAPPSIISSPNNTLLYTGDTTTMQCVTNAIPDPSVTYFYNAMPLPSNVIENGKLTLSNVTSTDSGVYQCFAQNTHGSASASWTVIVTDPSKKIVYNVLYIYVLELHQYGNLYQQLFQ